MFGRNGLLKRRVGYYLGIGSLGLLVHVFALPQVSPTAPNLAHGSTLDSTATTSAVERRSSSKQPVETDLVYEGFASYGHYRIFASGRAAKLYAGGIEYDRHSWGYFLKARMDYVAEVLPVVLLDAAAKYDIWGNPLTTARQIVPGFGFAPIGVRMLWRDGKVWKPYFTAKGGMLIFSQKAMSEEATYENFSFQSGIGILTRLSPRIDLRLGLLSDYHFSNGFMVPVNPGLDVMNANFGISYRLGKPLAR